MLVRFDSIVRVGSCMEEGAPWKIVRETRYDAFLFFFLSLLFRSIIKQVYFNTEVCRDSLYNFIIKLNWLLEIYCFLESKE